MAASHFSALKTATVSVDLPSIATVSTAAVDVTVTGIAVGDMLSVYRPIALNDDLVVAGYRIKSADTVTLFIYNPTGGAIDDAAQPWEFVWWDRT